MNDEILKRLDILAAKLGITAQYLWGVLVKQARIEMYADIGWSILLSGMLALFLWVLRKLYISPNEREMDGIAALGLAIASIIVFIFLVVSVSGALTEGLNPEYWALNHIMEKLK